MGYTTQFEGVLRFTEIPSFGSLQKLKTMLGESVPNHSYCQFELTTDLLGIEWDGGEKFYDATEAAQWLIDEMRKEFPNFGLKGELFAQGEEWGDVWILRCNGDTCERVKIELKGTKVKCPQCRHEFIAEAEK